MKSVLARAGVEPQEPTFARFVFSLGVSLAPA
jgi:hypothetical protein